METPVLIVELLKQQYFLPPKFDIFGFNFAYLKFSTADFLLFYPAENQSSRSSRAFQTLVFIFRGRVHQVDAAASRPNLASQGAVFRTRFFEKHSHIVTGRAKCCPPGEEGSLSVRALVKELYPKLFSRWPC